MQTVLQILSGVLVGGGCFFALTGAVGIHRMPDFYTRVHPAGKTDTLAQALIVLGLVLRCDDPVLMAKLGLLSGLVFVTSPTATHALTKAAYLDGLRPFLLAPKTQAGEPSDPADNAPTSKGPRS